MLISNTGKNFEKPDSGLFLGVLADVIYVKDKMTQYGPKDVVRLIWILDKKDKENNYYRVMTEASQSLHENSRLFAILKDINFGTPPPVPFDPDLMIGTVRNLVIVKEKSDKIDPKTGQPKEFSNIKAYMPTNPGQTFAVPQGFVRAKDKPAKGTQPQQKPQQTAGPAPQSAAAPAPNAAPVQAAPTNDQEISF